MKNAGNIENDFFVRQIFEPWNTVIESPEQVTKVIEWYSAGCDFADALHLAGSDAEVMHTFDRKFCKAACETGIAPKVRVWEI